MMHKVTGPAPWLKVLLRYCGLEVVSIDAVSASEPVQFSPSAFISRIGPSFVSSATRGVRSGTILFDMITPTGTIPPVGYAEGIYRARASIQGELDVFVLSSLAFLGTRPRMSYAWTFDTKVGWFGVFILLCSTHISLYGNQSQRWPCSRKWFFGFELFLVSSACVCCYGQSKPSLLAIASEGIYNYGGHDLAARMRHGDKEFEFLLRPTIKGFFRSTIVDNLRTQDLVRLVCLGAETLGTVLPLYHHPSSASSFI
jgi:hypothetical protein